jgi:hypothetical protein
VAIPVRILRVTQFHEFVPQIVEWGRQDDVIYVPKVRTRPVAARSVAEPSPGLANGSGRVPGSDGAPIAEIGGPREQRLVELARLLAARCGDPIRIEEVSNPAAPTTSSSRTAACFPARMPPSPAPRSRSGSTPRLQIPH